MVGDVISLFSVEELLLRNKNNTEIIVVIIEEILDAFLHRKNRLDCISPTPPKNDTFETPNGSTIKSPTNSHPVNLSSYLIEYSLCPRHCANAGDISHK